MRTDFRYVFGATALGLLMAGLFGAVVWLATGSWNYGGGAFLTGLYLAGPVSAWLVDRAIPAGDAPPELIDPMRSDSPPMTTSEPA